MRFKSYAVTVLVAATFLLASTGCPKPKDDPVPGETRTFDGIEFQWCPAGTFTMGCPVDDEWYYPHLAQHEVTISQGFWLGKYEVTQAQWSALMPRVPSEFKGDDRPVESVTWEQAQQFADSLNATTTSGGTYRLPTESEWEYAYRAGTKSRYYWGSDPRGTKIGAYAWYSGNSNSETHPVGEKQPNAWGLCDMGGNVWEWCQDLLVYPKGVETNREEPVYPYRMYRGGSWEEVAVYCCAYACGADEQTDEWNNVGFRLLRTAD
ncbi:MAG: formylglycine-generating enzyme family protein [Candidatus Hydrogenedentes bacterium]|nr:formylglycine-generating enzyme family protein [Candidatus Hydrogenedentota bacterium]